MKRFKISILILFVGIVLILGSTTFVFLDLGNGNTSSSGSRLSFVCIVISYFAVFLLINLKLRNREHSLAYALFYPVILFIALHIYTELYFFSKIDMKGVLTRGVVTSKENRVSGDASLEMSANYEYVVDGKKYFKYIFDDDLDVGDTIFLKYLKSNPAFHKYVSKKNE